MRRRQREQVIQRERAEENRAHVRTGERERERENAAMEACIVRSRDTGPRAEEDRSEPRVALNHAADVRSCSVMRRWT